MAKSVKKIVAIGGGEIRDSETLAIDKEIIRLTQKKHPKLLFIPTASSDNEDYYNGVVKFFIYSKKRRRQRKLEIKYLIPT